MPDSPSNILTSSDVAALMRESEALQARTNYMLDSALYQLGKALTDVKEARAIIKALVAECDEHDADYHHHTRPNVRDKAKDFILQE